MKRHDSDGNQWMHNQGTQGDSQSRWPASGRSPQQIDDEGPPKPKRATVSEREFPRQKGLDSSRLSTALDCGCHGENRRYGKGNHCCPRQEFPPWPFGMHQVSGQIVATRNHAPLPECSYVNRISSPLTTIIVGGGAYLRGLGVQPELIQHSRIREFCSEVLWILLPERMI
jgi:hypothetical protein